MFPRKVHVTDIANFVGESLGSTRGRMVVVKRRIKLACRCAPDFDGMVS
jgi:hypothetical protein